MLKAPLTAALIVAATAIGAPQAANAKPVITAPAVTTQVDVQTVGHRRGYHRYHVLPKRIVVRSLYKRGYRDVHRVHFRNGYWRARAQGRRGLIALKIHPRTGEILRRRVVQHYHRPAPRHYRGHRGSLTFSFGFH